MSSAKPLSDQDSKALLDALDNLKEKRYETSLVLANELLNYFYYQPFINIFEKAFTRLPTSEHSVLLRFVLSELANPLSRVRAYTAEVHSQIILYKIKHPEIELPDINENSVNDSFIWLELLEQAWESYDGSAKYLKKLPLEIGTKLAISPERYYWLMIDAYEKWLMEIAKTSLEVGETSVFDSTFRKLGFDEF